LFELLKRPEASDGKLRVLLLARSDAFWPTLARTLGNAGVGVSVRALPALAEDGTARTAMFDAAVKAFGTEAVASGQVDSTTVKRPDLSAEGFKVALAVQVAALVAVLRARERTHGVPPAAAGEALADPAAVTRELLVREVDHCRSCGSARPTQ